MMSILSIFGRQMLHACSSGGNKKAVSNKHNCLIEHRWMETDVTFTQEPDSRFLNTKHFFQGT